MGTFWNEVEAAPRGQIEEIQREGIGEAVRWATERVPFWRERLRERGLRPEEICSPEDLRKIPLTTKSDLRYQYPLGLSAAPREEIVLFQATSGTTGRPVIVPYTREDLEVWADCMARALWAAGVRAEDVCLNAYSYGLFTGGLGYHYGAERIGCAIIPASAGYVQRQVLLLRDLGPTVLLSTPTYALRIAEEAEGMGVDLEGLPLKVGHFGAEPWSEGLRKELERRMGIRAHEMYGLTEMRGPGVAFSCEYFQLHINEDCFYPEVIDPVTEEPLEEGEEGELVLTPLGRSALPLLRYRTGDLTALDRSPCRCGRTLVRMRRVRGRIEEMIVLGRERFFPVDVEEVLLGFPELTPHYLIRLLEEEAVRVEVEVREGTLKGKREGIKEEIREEIRRKLGIEVMVELLEQGKIPRSEGKARRVQRG